MAETTPFMIGADVSCRDGNCGTVIRVVRAVTHLAVGPKGLGRLVPVSLADTTTGEIRLNCTMAEFEKLERAEETHFPMGNDDRINALSSLYAAERADLSNLGNQLIGVAGFAVTYIAAIFIVLGHTNPKHMTLLWFAAPIPIYVFLAFFTLSTTLSMGRTESCKKLEEAIAPETEIAASVVGIHVSDRVMDIRQASWGNKPLIASAFGPILLGGLAVIIYLIYQTFHIHVNTAWRVIAIAVYAVLFLPILLRWIRLLRKGSAP
jgi:hypothetical protein